MVDESLVVQDNYKEGFKEVKVTVVETSLTIIKTRTGNTVRD